MGRRVMHWMNKPRPTVGSERVVTRFLFLKLRLGDETRWLSRERILQQYVRLYPNYVEHWENMAWMDA